MTDQDDAALHAALQADASTLKNDVEALRVAMATPEWLGTLESVAARVFPLVEPFLVMEASGIGGPLAGGAAKIVGDAIAAKLVEMAPKQKVTQ